MPEYCTVSEEVGSHRYSGGAVQQKKYNIDSVRILKSGIKIFFVLVKTMAWSVLLPEYCIVSRGVGSRSQYIFQSFSAFFSVFFSIFQCF